MGEGDEAADLREIIGRLEGGEEVDTTRERERKVRRERGAM